MGRRATTAEWAEKTYVRNCLNQEEAECNLGTTYYTQGHVDTEFTTVHVVGMSWMSKRGKRLRREGFTRLSIVGHGQTHVREFLHRLYAPRHIVTLAKRFAREAWAAGVLHKYTLIKERSL